ncbi:MAG TPA: N-acetylglucosamine-6-phosphate deacetylase [Anaerolineae bacterium]|nr:N-acetylglucosamine-6-phosphate deacetylase [Anaerolineae bacterium]
MVIRGRHYLLGEVCDFNCENGVIREIRPPDGARAVLGSPDHWVLPGLIDIQVNGYKGIDFCSESLTPEQVEEASLALAEAGVVAFCPTIITNSAEAIEASLCAIAEAWARGGAARDRILGIHLEGPYISPLDGPRGTHPLAHVRHPDWNEFRRWQDVSGGRIRIVTLAPELPGAIEFIARARRSGTLVAIGHHAATREQINAAVAAGAVMSTHLGNGAHSELPRHPNYIWEQLANDGLMAGIIVDGHHLPPSVVKTFFRTKGVDRLILVSDVVWLAGLTPGKYRFAEQDVELREDNSVRLVSTPFLAGSALKLIDAVSNIQVYADASLADAVRMSATNPVQLLNATERGRLLLNERADLLLVRPRANDRGLTLDATMIGGQIAYQNGQGM